MSCNECKLCTTETVKLLIYFLVKKDNCPQWRKLAWSQDCSMLACSYRFVIKVLLLLLLLLTCHIYRLTTASLSGGWVPGVSKGFHFWQPAPRLNNAPMAGTMLQLSYEPPRTRDKKQSPVTLKIQWKEREKQQQKKEGRGGRAR